MRFSPERLTQAREAAGLKRSELAFHVRRLNTDLKPDGSTIANYEGGKRNTPSANMLAAIAQALGHPIEFFYESGGDDDEEEEAALRAALPFVTEVSLSKAMHERVKELADRSREQVRA